jgi:branched-chain amino acid aminotransferase
MYYHVNGDLVDERDASVSVRDRGFMYGDAAFETLRTYGGTVFAWEAHRERLERTCRTLGMPDAVPDDLDARIHETLAANDLSDAYVRVSVTRGEQPGKLTPQPDVDPTVVVLVAALPRSGVDGDGVWDDPATVRTVETRRIPDEAMPADVKTHNYLDGILARLELRETEADEALVRNVDGYVAEGATSNVCFVADGTLHTPSLDGPILPGVTRAVVLDLAEAEGIPVETGHYTVDDVRAADEVFLTNTTWEIRPVSRVDDVAVDPGATTARLSEAFDRRVERYY